MHFPARCAKDTIVCVFIMKLKTRLISFWTAFTWRRGLLCWFFPRLNPEHFYHNVIKLKEIDLYKHISLLKWQIKNTSEKSHTYFSFSFLFPSVQRVVRTVPSWKMYFVLVFSCLSSSHCFICGFCTLTRDLMLSIQLVCVLQKKQYVGVSKYAYTVIIIYLVNFAFYIQMYCR